MTYSFDPQEEEMEIPDKTCQRDDGVSYRGTVSVTVEGRVCLPWDQHSHHYTKAKFGEKYGLDYNYCRNPASDGEGAWCYIKSSHKSLYWQYCPVPKCGAERQKISDKTCQKGNGVSYRGTVNVTTTGKACLPWDKHSSHYTKARFGEKNGLYKNYCRNPEADEDRVWCYVKSSYDDTYWEFCPVPQCDTESYEERGQSYRGTTAMGWKGEPCREWAGNGKKYNPKAYPDSDLTKNYCRNPSPGSDHAPWCYLVSSSKLDWDYCAIPKCMKNKP
ncbi:PLG [Branchiostoma lanceolatum]|uniref:PLG protein n=1 Tax=Branchiostoma lanceolatum TaxID=7740 RepID=A0A8K0EAV0_BRALA|nr:PLG [Branchiostoma lanceolatum]